MLHFLPEKNKTAEANPMITVSALNRLDTFLFDAPMARRIPISLVRSCTEINVIRLS
jgi:hypothetical protein